MAHVSVARLAAVALLPVLVVASSCGSTERADERTRDLSSASLTVIDDEVWVYGGVSAPVGTAPPVTSELPPGWEPNRAVTVYDAQGDVTRTFQLPPLADAVLFGRILASEGTHHLLGTTCQGSMGCGPSAEPVLFQFSDGTVETLELELPPLDPTTEFPMLHVLGQTGSTAWALQEVGPGTTSPSDQVQHRLLAIDLATGAGTEIALEDGVHGPAWVCVGNDRLFRVDATFDQTSHRLLEARVYSRPATSRPTAWDLLKVLPFEPQPVLFGNLHCLNDQELLLLTHGLPDSHLITLAMSNGQETEPRATLPGSLTVHLGTLDDAAIVVSQVEAGTLWRHPPTGPWHAIADPDLERPAHPILLDGRLVDAQHLLEKSGGQAAPLLPIAPDTTGP